MEKAFETFVESVPFYGFSVLCLDHEGVQGLVAKITDRRVITYGQNPQADVRVVNLRADTDGSRFDVVFAQKRNQEARTITDLHLPMAGLHNVLNAVAAIIVAVNLGASDEQIRLGLANFEGVKRRFTLAGTYNGIRIIDDYGHHPVEIKAVLAAARQTATGKVVAVVQPHRYTRLRDLFDDFCRCLNDADIVAIADVYTAGESPIEGINADTYVQAARDFGHKNVQKLNSPDDLPQFFRDNTSDGDIFVCLGAGDITNWANGLEAKLKG
jgi:UDP-N-acetylmuramate--alanine ligase